MREKPGILEDVPDLPGFDGQANLAGTVEKRLVPHSNHARNTTGNTCDGVNERGFPGSASAKYARDAGGR
jgi:hypothetical protein